MRALTKIRACLTDELSSRILKDLYKEFYWLKACRVKDKKGEWTIYAQEPRVLTEQINLRRVIERAAKYGGSGLIDK